MGLFNKIKDKNYLAGFDNWLDSLSFEPMDDNVVSFCFNIYEDGVDKWSIELVGCSSFSEDDDDWACDEVTDFRTRENNYAWTEKANWEDIKEKCVKAVSKYLKNGKYSKILQSKRAIAVGFVDGDLSIIK